MENIVRKLTLGIFQYHIQFIQMKLSVLAAVMTVLAILSPSSVEANYCVNCDTFLSCMVLCRNGYNKLQRVDRWRGDKASQYVITSCYRNVYNTSNRPAPVSRRRIWSPFQNILRRFRLWLRKWYLKTKKVMISLVYLYLLLYYVCMGCVLTNKKYIGA